jgi:hypothetical protein
MTSIHECLYTLLVDDLIYQPGSLLPGSSLFYLESRKVHLSISDQPKKEDDYNLDCAKSDPYLCNKDGRRHCLADRWDFQMLTAFDAPSRQEYQKDLQEPLHSSLCPSFQKDDGVEGWSSGSKCPVRCVRRVIECILWQKMVPGKGGKMMREIGRDKPGNWASGKCPDDQQGEDEEGEDVYDGDEEETGARADDLIRLRTSA